MRARAGSWRWWLGLVALGASVVVVSRSADLRALAGTLEAAISRPGALLTVVVAYAGAFALRAALWQRVLPGIPFGQALAALHVSLAGNHVLPARLGEALRVTSLVRRTDARIPEAIASTLTLRAADVLAVVTLGALLGHRAPVAVAGPWLLGLVAAAATVGAGGLWCLRRSARRPAAGSPTAHIRPPGLLVFAGAVAAWVLEGLVLWQAASWAGLRLPFADAVLVTAVTIAAQVVAVVPGGVGTYEAAATAAFVALGAPPGPALAAAVAAHAVKTGYALVAGAVACIAPAPGLLGRLRLPTRPRSAGTAAASRRPVGRGPVVLFLAAHDEQASVAAVVGRVPASVCGRLVRCLVVDDGSVDRTAEHAALAGAEVVRHERNRGLGAAVRRGLREAVRRDAAAVAFCDADGEYEPAELDRLVAPILAGKADYVVGSRFRGQIRRMHLHRRLGNRVLTALLRLVARVPLTDGQSGFRALSPQAARDAEVIHDFNYAQVLTLDLLAKGYRYAEVPISYGFRRHGRSFVRLGGYLRAVVPAVHRELNAG